MTEQHPLTEKICADILPFYPETEHDFIEMRTAADWQLEQVIEWLKTNTEDYVLEDYYSTYFLIEAFLDDFKKAMRPQQQKENN